MDPQISAILGSDPQPFKSVTLISDLMTSLQSMDPQILAILGPDPIPFETLISDLMTSSNEQRSQAESLFNSCKTVYCDDVATKLVKLLEHSPCLEARAMSAILLPTSFKKYVRLFESTQSRVKSGLVNCVVNEQNKPIIKILGNTISKFVARYGWPELMPFMFDYVASEDPRLQESALFIFTQLAQYAGESLVPHITHLHDVFMNCLGNLGSADIRIAALSAVINLIPCLKSSSDRDRFQDLFPSMMQCLTQALNPGNEAMAQKVLVLLIELAGTDLSFFRERLVEVVEGMLQIAETNNLEEGTRHLAIEFVITSAEAKWDLPQLIFCRFFAILMTMLLDIEDEAAWHSAENEDADAGESSNYSVGHECLHRLATVLGGNTNVLVVYEQLSAYLAAPEWQKHLAALIALAQITKRLSEVMIQNLEQVVIMVLNSFQDAHPRVRWAAINAIEQLSTYVGPFLRVQYQDRMLLALYLALDDIENPRVQARAVSALLHFSSHSPNLDGIILNKLIVLPLTDSIIRVLKLANSLEESTDVQIRDSLAIQLGEMFEEPLAVLTLDLVKRKLLRCVEKEDNRSVTKSLCHAIVRFFNVLCIESGWPELFSSVERWALGDNDLLKEAAMLILGPLRYRPISSKVYCVCLENASADTRIAAFSAAIRYTQDNHPYMNVPLVPKMTRVLTQGLNEGEEVTTQKALKLLIEWAHQTQIKLSQFSGSSYKSYDMVPQCPFDEYISRMEQLVMFFSSAIEIAESQSLKKETRHLAIDFVITLVEKIHRKHMMNINKLFVILMSDINEAASHWEENEDDDAGESSNFSVLLKFLDRLAFRLDKNSVAWPKLEQYLGAEWQERVTAILALAQISKVYLKVTKKDFNQLVSMVLAQFEYSHSRVRLAAIHATGQLYADLDPCYQFQYHRRVLPYLATAIYDFQYPQVQEHAASAVLDISKNYPPDTLTPYLVEIVGTLLEFRRRDDIASDQIHTIENLLKQFRAKLQPDAWASTWSSLHFHQQSEFLFIVAR